MACQRNGTLLSNLPNMLEHNWIYLLKSTLYNIYVIIKVQAIRWLLKSSRLSWFKVSRNLLINVSVKNPSVVKIRNIISVVVAYIALMFSRNSKNSALIAVAGNVSNEVPYYSPLWSIYTLTS